MIIRNENISLRPVLLIIESDKHVVKALNAELEGNFALDLYPSLEEAFKANELGFIYPKPIAAVVEMKKTTKDELAGFANFFSQLPPIPIFLTLYYDSDFQLHESYIKSWTRNILFRPFEIDKLVNSIKSIISQTREAYPDNK